MRDSAMVIMWPTRDADSDSDSDSSYASVTLSQRKAPYETMPTPDPDPPFIAKLDLSETSVRFSLNSGLYCSMIKLTLMHSFPTRSSGTILRWRSHDL